MNEKGAIIPKQLGCYRRNRECQVDYGPVFSGNLAEQLGLLLLKGIAAVADVPRTEDVGVERLASAAVRSAVSCMPWLAGPLINRFEVFQRLDRSIREFDADSRSSVRRVHSDQRSVGERDNDIEQLLRFLFGAELGDDCLGQLTKSCVNGFLCELKAEPLDPRHDRVLENSGCCCTQGDFYELMWL